MCFPGSANWKREIVPDHKFDFVDVEDYHSDSFGTRLQYLWLYILLIKSFMVYLSDLFSAITMLTTKQWSNNIFAQCKTNKLSNCVVVDFSVGKWIFVGCIIFGYLLLVYETWKANKIVNSRDISYTFTNVMAQNYYSFRSYNHFCFFQQIENSTKKKDDFAFFVFFTFKGWKRLLLSDGPRQTINAMTLYSFWLVNQGQVKLIERYWNDQTLITKFLLISILFTVLVFVGSLLILIVAALCYVPLLCYIQGNLKEYCCHKVDKRITELLKRKTRQRIQRQAQLAQREARGDFSHLKNRKGELVRNPVPQPTLPNLEITEFDEYSSTRRAKSNYASSYTTSTTKNDGYGAYPGFPPDLNGSTPDYPPPMPLYDQYGHGSAQFPHTQYDQSSVYPPSERRDNATSPTHFAGAGDSSHNVDRYHVGTNNRASVHSNGSIGLAYDVDEPRTPHRRKASGTGMALAREREEDVVLAHQARDGYSYQQQWPGYGRDQHGHEQYPPPQQGHSRQRSNGHDEYGHAM